MADKNTTQTVSKGRIVFYQNGIMVEDAIEPYAAIVTKVRSNDVVDLTVFPPGNPPYPMTAVEYFDNSTEQEMAWWWPPRV